MVLGILWVVLYIYAKGKVYGLTRSRAGLLLFRDGWATSRSKLSTWAAFRLKAVPSQHSVPGKSKARRFNLVLEQSSVYFQKGTFPLTCQGKRVPWPLLLRIGTPAPGLSVPSPDLGRGEAMGGEEGRRPSGLPAASGLEVSEIVCTSSRCLAASSADRGCPGVRPEAMTRAGGGGWWW